MADPLLLNVQIAGNADVLKALEDIGKGGTAAFSAPVGAIDQLNESITGLSEAIEKLGKSTEETGSHVEKLGGAATASFGLLKTSIEGAVSVLTGGGFTAALGVVRELGRGVEETAKHFGTLGEAIGAASVRFGGFVVAIGAIGGALLELGTHAAHAILDVINLATVMNTSIEQVAALRRRFVELGLSEEQAGAVIRTVATRIEEAWVSIQKEVRDAAESIGRDSIGIAEATRGVAQAVIGAREAVISTAEAEQNAAAASSDAQRSAASAVINANEAVIQQKEAQLDATTKLADAERAYQDSVVAASDAQMRYAETLKAAEYSGQDAGRALQDAFDKVKDAEREAADAAQGVQEAMLSVAEAATSVRGAYISLHQAELEYREAHGGGKITRAERQELRREQSEVGLEQAQERVRGAELAEARTRRDAVPQAQEREGRAERGVQAAREGLDKAEQQFEEAGQKTANALEKAGSALAQAIETIAKRALGVEVAPQRAADETAKAQIDVDRARAEALKASFEATFAQVKADDALLTARINQKSSTDKVTLAEYSLTDARNKAIEDFSNSIKTLTEAARTGRLPAGADPNLIRPESIARAAIQTGGGDVLKTLDAAQNIAQQLRLTGEQIFALLHELGVQRGAETTQLVNAMKPLGEKIVTVPTGVDIKRAQDIREGEAGARELITAEREAAEALNAAAIKWGNLITPELTAFLKQDMWKQAGEALGLAFIATLVTGGAAAALGVGAVKGAASLAGKVIGKGGVAAGTAGEEGFFELGKTAPKAAQPALTTAEALGLGAKPAAETSSMFADILAGLGKLAPVLRGIGAVATGTQIAALPALQGPTALPGAGDIQTQMKESIAADDAARESFRGFLRNIGGMLGLGGGQQAAKPEAAKPEEPKPEAAKPEEPKPKTDGATADKLDAAAKKLDDAGVRLIEAAKALTGDKSATKGGSLGEVAAKLDQIVTKFSSATAGGDGGGKLDGAAVKLDEAAGKLDEAAGKIGSGADKAETGGGSLTAAADKIGAVADHLDQIGAALGAAGGGPDVRTAKQGEDAINSIKESIDKLVSGKGLIQPPTEKGARAEYDEAVRKLLDSLTGVNEAQKGLIEEQARALAETENLTKKQEELTAAQTAKVKQETADEHARSERQVQASGGGGGGGGAGAGGGGGGGGGIDTGGGGAGATAGMGEQEVEQSDRAHRLRRVAPNPPPGPVRSGPGGLLETGPPAQPMSAEANARLDRSLAEHAAALREYVAKTMWGDPLPPPGPSRHARRPIRDEQLDELYPMGHPPLSPDSPLRRRGEEGQGPRRHDFSTVMPDGEKFNTTVTKLETGATKFAAAADGIHTVVDSLGDVVSKLGSGGGHAAGGPVIGPGGPTEDRIPIRASAGEYIVNAASTAKHRGLIEAINNGGELRFQWGGAVPNVMGQIAAHGGTEPSQGAIQSALTSNIGIGPGGYMTAKMQTKTQSYAVDLRTDHGTFTVLATEDQMGTMLQSSISSRIASTGTKPSWWS